MLLPACAAPEAAVVLEQRVRAEWTYDEGAAVRGDRSEKRLALIFTGGEHGEGTKHILDVLAAAGIKASFFVTGDYLAIPEYRALVPRMVARATTSVRTRTRTCCIARGRSAAA